LEEPVSERKIIDLIDAGRDAQIEFLAALVRTPSDNPPGDCAPHADRAAALIEALGFEVERYEVPSDLVREIGMISATNLIIRRQFAEGPTIALNAHGDVVPAGEGWSLDPYGAEVREGWMYGRGVAVSKSDFATYIFALKALEQSRAPLAGTIELHFTYDEEAGGEMGPKWLLDQGLTRPDLAISAGFSYAVVTAHNGCLHLEVQVSGRSAHAARPESGVDALEAANAILTALYEERKTYAERPSATPGIGPPQMTVGLISGGINTNVVPDHIVFRLDRRIVPEENPGQVEARMRQVIDQASAVFPEAQLEVRRILLAEPLVPRPGAERLTDILCRRATEIFSCEVSTGGVPLYTDARHYAAAGVPTVLYGAGPRTIEEANAHRADERLPLDDLHGATKVIALTLFDLLAAS
jgi:acetylornithine deacetylase/succinyl-diaminopimelate desuccinylase family protein